MTMKIPVHQMIFILLVSICASTAALQMAKTGCKPECGGLPIPYPFGIGPNVTCYRDEWFQIDCNKSTEWKPVLRRTNLEVLNITTDGRLLVYSPITVFCKGNKSSQVADLTGSPFFYSQMYNIFTAVSCDSFALLRSANFVVGGCRSVCDQSYEYGSCDKGINCCQTSIPPYLTVINTTLEDPEPTTNCNKSAFLVDKDWFTNLSYYSSSISDMKSMRRVPVALEWSIINDTISLELFKEFVVDFDRYFDVVHFGWFFNNSYDYYNSSPWDPSCYISTPGVVNRSDIYCSCGRGFEGNPYLGLDYCEDIDECVNVHQCFGASKCVNYLGSYQCEETQESNRNSNKVKLILAAGIGSGLGFIVLLNGAWRLYKLWKNRKTIKLKKFFKQNGGLLLEQLLSSGEVNVEKIKLFNSKELEKATDRFNVDRVLGEGGQGTVYKGMLADGRIVAVKKSKIVDGGEVGQFINEIVILSQINHRNVVKLLGCCLETEVPLLVYEFIPKGTIYQYLHEQNEEFPLTWELRLRISAEVAGALAYLHSAAGFPIYHRDIKSTNILLDDKYRAKVADFGTSRSVSIDQTHLTTFVSGTFGYLDPQYFQSSQFTDKSDVYSFGVVLVELLTGEKPVSLTRSLEARGLVSYFHLSLESNNLFDIIDARVKVDGVTGDILAVADLAKRCLEMNGKRRPTMKEVAVELEVIHKSVKSSNIQQNHEDLEYVRNEATCPWDDSSTSIRSALDAGSSSSIDSLPLMSN